VTVIRDYTGPQWIGAQAIAADLAALGIHGVDPYDVREVADCGDHWEVTSNVTDRGRIRRVDGVPLTVTVNHPKAS
jgi:hypothetical protein